MAHSDGQAGTPVTLVVQPGQTAPPSSPPPYHPLPYTGLPLLTLLALAALLVAVGAALTAVRRPAR